MISGLQPGGEGLENFSSGRRDRGRRPVYSPYTIAPADGVAARAVDEITMTRALASVQGPSLHISDFDPAYDRDTRAPDADAQRERHRDIDLVA